MKIENIQYIWVIIDEHSNIKTDKFSPEVENLIIPDDIVKKLDNSHPDCKLQRLKIEQR